MAKQRTTRPTSERGSEGPQAAFAEKSSSSLSMRKARSDIKVLIVDDNRLLLRSANRNLKLGGFETTMASDAKQALEIIEKAEEPFDVIVTDFHMPDVNGVQLIEELKEKHSDKFRGIILSSGSAGVKTRLSALEAGAKVTLPKPIEAYKLIVAVDAVAAFEYVPEMEAAVNIAMNVVHSSIEFLGTIPSANVMRAAIEVVINEMKDVNEEPSHILLEEIKTKARIRLERVKRREEEEKRLRASKAKPADLEAEFETASSRRQFAIAKELYQKASAHKDKEAYEALCRLEDKIFGALNTYISNSVQELKPIFEKQ